MGPDGMQVLLNQFTNAPAPVRMQIAMTLVSPESMYRGENVPRPEASEIPTDVLIDGLTRIVQDSTSGFFRMPAIQRLGAFGPVASNAVPALLPMLSNPNPSICQSAIHALGRIKAQPDVVIPALLPLLNHPSLGTRIEAVSALRAFGYDAQMPSELHFRGRTNSIIPRWPVGVPSPPSELDSDHL
jgi:hypothetical protein